MSDWIEKYSTFSGADIVASVESVVFATLQSISWSTSRAKGPIHVMNGSPDPIAYGRGIRAVAGQLSFVNLDKDALLDYMKQTQGEKPWISKNDHRVNTFETDGANQIVGDKAWADWEAAGNAGVTGINNDASIDHYRIQADPEYADQLLPFDIHISFTNEYGKAARKSLLGVEILNEGSGISIEDISLDSQYNFVARKITKMVAIENSK